MWAEAENADDVKANCCDFLVGEKLLNLFGDDPWYAGWPKVPNHEYQYLERVLNAMREGLNELERAVMSTNLKEWLQQTIAELEEERDAVPGVVNEDAVMALEAMKIALASLLYGKAEQTNYRAIVERIAEIVHGKVTDIDLLTVTVKSMKDKLQK